MAWVLKSCMAAAIIGGGSYYLGVDESPSKGSSTMYRLVLAAAPAQSDGVASQPARNVVLGGGQRRLSVPEPSGIKRFADERLAQAASAPKDEPVPAKASDPGSGVEPVTVLELDPNRRLAGRIQGELKRVGCYAGQIDGDWGTASRKAMAEFNKRINATLPVDQPDYILLTLLQGHSARACGACALGEVADDGGRCQPRAVLAEARRAGGQTLGVAVAQAIETGSTAALPLPRKSIAAEESRRRLEEAELERLREAQRLASRSDAAQQRAALEQARKERAAAATQETTRKAAEAANTRRLAELARVQEQDRARQAAVAELARQQKVAAARALAAAVSRSRLVGDEVSRNSGEETPASVAAAVTPPDLPVRRPPGLLALGAPIAKADKADVVPAAPRSSASTARRYVGRYIPPPTYRVGRLAPPPPRVSNREDAEERPRRSRVGRIEQPRRQVYRAAASSGQSRKARLQAVFLQTQRNAP